VFEHSKVLDISREIIQPEKAYKIPTKGQFGIGETLMALRATRKHETFMTFGHKEE